MKKLLLFLLSAGLLASFADAQQKRDFLTPDEITQLRDTQEPNARIVLYLQFASSRIGQLKQQIAKEKTGRSAFIHDLIEDYARIIDAIDTVGDDALKRQVDISIGMSAAVKGERDMVGNLKKILESAPSDLARYEFVLKDAIETTNDSIELCQEDLGKRSTVVAAKQSKEKAEQEAAVTPEDAKQRKADAPANQTKKPPTLLKPGESLPNK